jgi:protein-tyrosine phosphatase
MAEALTRAFAGERGIPLEVRSAGVAAADGMPVSENTLYVLHQRNVSYDGKSEALRDEQIRWADLILTMTSGHKRALLYRYPDAADKTFTLKEYAFHDEAMQSLREEYNALLSDAETKQALGQPVDDAVKNRLAELEQLIPADDIGDPFGGTVEIYEACAREIEQAVHRLLDKLAGQR